MFVPLLVFPANELDSILFLLLKRYSALLDFVNLVLLKLLLMKLFNCPSCQTRGTFEFKIGNVYRGWVSPRNSSII